MSIRIQIIMLLFELLYFIFIVSLLKKKKIMLSYSLTWLFAGVVITVFTVFPNLMSTIFSFLQIESPMNGILSLLVFFLMVIMIILTSIVSKQTSQIRTLTQENAILENRLKEVESKVK